MLKCGSFELPLCFVTAISWQRRARTVTHKDGSVTARGYEPAEVSVKAHFSMGICKAFGHDPEKIYGVMYSTVTERKAEKSQLTVGRYTIYPELNFALTNINKTFSPDDGIMDVDMVFSGVGASKEVARAMSLREEPARLIPKLTLSVGKDSMEVQDALSVSLFKTAPDSLELSLSIGDDMSFVSRDGFLTDLLHGGIVQADLPQGNTVYYVVQADLTEESLSLTGSVYPPRSQRAITKTYQNTSLSAIILDLADIGGIPCTCLADGQISYYRAFGTPLQCIRELCGGAGCIMSVRGGRMTVVDVPESIEAEAELSYISIQADGDSEPIHGCYWFDGIHKDTVGDLDTSALRIASPFASSGRWASRCLRYARYAKNALVAECEIDPSLDSHSAVRIDSNDSEVSCMAEYIEYDWLSNTMQVELHAVDG